MHTVGQILVLWTMIFSLIPTDNVAIDYHQIDVPEIKKYNIAEKEKKKRRKIVAEARKYIGLKYTCGGNTPRGFDCSGFVQYVYKSQGFVLERSSRAIVKSLKMIPLRKVQIGDIVYFTQNGKINHIAIVSKKEKGKIGIIHSTNSRGVIEESLEDSYYWKEKIGGAVTFF